MRLLKTILSAVLAAGLIIPVYAQQMPEKPIESHEGCSCQRAMVGEEAPGFTLPAYHQDNFTTVSLEQFKGQWVLLCFYPGDFTFV